MPRVLLRIDDLTLRTLEPEDAQSAFDAVDSNRDELRSWFPWVDETRTVADSLKFIESTLRECDTMLAWAAAVWQAERLVGHIGIHERNARCKRSEIGYWISGDAQGRGLCTRASAGLLDQAFRSGLVHKIILHADSLNRPSNRVAVKLGFRLEGVLIEQDWNPGRQQWRDLNVYGLLASEYLLR